MNFEPVEKVQAIKELYLKLNVVEEVNDLIDSYFSKAFNKLDQLQVSDQRKADLRAFSKFLINRDH